MTQVIKQQPWGLMSQLQDEMERLFEARMGRTPHGGHETATDWVPAVDIREEDARFVLEADLPGVKAEDIEVTMEDGVLTLRGSRETERREEGAGFRRLERVAGTFFRRFTLPDTADAEAITAKSDNGVLEIVIPKHAKVQPRRISIDVS